MPQYTPATSTDGRPGYYETVSVEGPNGPMESQVFRFGEIPKSESMLAVPKDQNYYSNLAHPTAQTVNDVQTMDYGIYSSDLSPSDMADPNKVVAQYETNPDWSANNDSVNHYGDLSGYARRISENQLALYDSDGKYVGVGSSEGGGWMGKHGQDVTKAAIAIMGAMAFAPMLGVGGTGAGAGGLGSAGSDLAAMSGVGETGLGASTGSLYGLGTGTTAGLTAPTGALGTGMLSDATVAGTGMTVTPGVGTALTNGATGLGLDAASTGIGLTGGTAGTVGANGAILTGADALGGGLTNTITGGTLGSGVGTGALTGTTTGALTGATTGTGLLSGLANATGLSATTLSGLLSGVGGLLNSNARTDAANQNASDMLAAGQKAYDFAKFKPVGVTTRFGQSNFGYDANGNLTSAGYTLSPEMKAQQDRLMGVSNNMLTQYEGAQAATAPMAAGAQSMFNLGQQYLSTSPEQQAQRWMQDQQALLAGTREQSLSSLQNKLAQQGRMGLATGGTSTGLQATNPEMAAYYNAMMQQDLGLAANASQEGRNYATFGANMMQGGGNLLNGMYSTQNNAFQPYSTALGGATTIEGLGQQPLSLGMDIGKTASGANTAAGGLLTGATTNAANMRNNATIATGSPWGNFFTGLATL